MKTICFYFQIHQPQRLKSYNFTNIGLDHYYYDDFANENVMENVARISYLPANKLLLKMIEESKGAFKCAFSISGIALEQMEIYAPEVITSFKELADTGCVEFLAEPLAYSLSSLIDAEEFKHQVSEHKAKIQELFNQTPKIFRNTNLIYSDEISEMVDDMGFKATLIEGARHILGWKSPNFIYNSSLRPNLKLLLRNERFSEDISLRFGTYTWDQYPLTSDKFLQWIADTNETEKIFNLFLNYEVIGNFYKQSSGIFDFFEALPVEAQKKNITFSLPSDVVSTYKSVSHLSVPLPISWLDSAKGLSAWLGNSLQQEAFNKLYSLSERVRMSSSRSILRDWTYLQSSDNLYYMDTKNNIYFSPYPSIFDAFINFMNILSDFTERVKDEFPAIVENEELNSLVTMIHNQANEIARLEKELKKAKH